ncbi:glycosyltransferase family 2 protein [Lacisediminimonas profundi]|uniref:glycosyltransferase family 2 protein n=1 Tax=Lacisediminimonas profundi TaxID=2603856 RepID=UPI00124AF2B8|nr:glycosyltransferase family 2 protein [Lacisediminimonas profundi]
MIPTRIADLTVVIVTYNSAHCMPALMEGLRTVPSVILVDNGSVDDTISAARQARADVTVIANGRNIGFGAANNKALAMVSTRYALLMNPDCLPTAAFFDALLPASDQFPDAAILAPHLIRRNGLPEVSYRWPSTRWDSRGPQADGPCCVGFVCGAAMLLNMDLMREVGFFDETFFLYYEDEDLCQRVFDAGRQIVLVPGVTITHLSRGSVKGPAPLKSEFIRGYHHAQSKLVFEHKHFGIAQASRLRWKTLLLALLTLLPRLLLPQPRYLARLVGRIAGLCRPWPRTRGTAGEGSLIP